MVSLVSRLVFQVIGSVLIYDAMFFFIHLMLHKHRKLYLLLHERHHVQDVMHAHVTNQLSMGERVTLVLAANQALKILFRLVCLQAHVQISALFLSSIQCKYCSYFFQSVTVVFFIANFNIICFE